MLQVVVGLQSLYSAECRGGPTRQCHQATSSFPPISKFEIPVVPRRLYMHTLFLPQSRARSTPRGCMGKAISLLRPPQPPREDEAGMMELRKRPRPRRVDPDFVSSPPPPTPPRKRARKQAAAAAAKPKDAAVPAKQHPPTTKRPGRPAVGIGCPVAGLHRVTCSRQPPLRTSARVLFRPRRPFNW
jgi:hypothetical protein